MDRLLIVVWLAASVGCSSFIVSSAPLVIRVIMFGVYLKYTWSYWKMYN